MTVLLRSESDSPARDVVVFGTGAIGGAIARRLLRIHPFTASKIAVAWDTPASRRETLSDLAAQLESRDRPASIIWAAGRAGFAATDDQTAGELESFKDVVELVQQVGSAGAMPAFHVVSSAGGLFEGRMVRAPSEEPTPLRSYGHLKLAQEQHCLAELPRDHVAIYRPSSVYSLPGHGQRLGLIGVLVRNGMAQRTTTIVGALETLRDYVLASDIGAYVAARALADDGGTPTVNMLVSGTPASILQVIGAVESVIRRRVYVRIAEAWNAQNITFSASVRAPRFKTVPLRVGVERVHAASLGSPASG